MERRSLGRCVALVAPVLIVVGCSRATAVIAAKNDAATSAAAPRASSIAHNGPRATWLSMSSGNACAVREGQVWCWGGELGITDLDRVALVPTRVQNLQGVTSVSVSSAHACAVVADGGVRCWGDNRWGQLGDGTTIERKAPVAVRGLSGATRVSAGQHHTCALVGDAAQCWGYGAYGQLGIGSAPKVAMAPQRVRGLEHDVVAIGVDGFSSCALAKGRLLTWGKNSEGELGMAPFTDRLVPVDAPIQRPGLVNLARARDRCCGFGSDGFACFGADTFDSRTSMPSLSGVSAFAVNDEGYACVVTNGSVGCFSIGAPAVHPLRLPAAATEVAVGHHESGCALADGEVYCWGNRGFGALGDGSPSQKTYDPRYRREDPAPVRW